MDSVYVTKPSLLLKGNVTLDQVSSSSELTHCVVFVLCLYFLFYFVGRKGNEPFVSFIFRLPLVERNSVCSAEESWLLTFEREVADVKTQHCLPYYLGLC